MKPGRGAQLTSSPSFFTGQRTPTGLPVAGRDKDSCSRTAPGNMECATCGQFLGTCTHSQVREAGNIKTRRDLYLHWCPGAAGRNPHKPTASSSRNVLAPSSGAGRARGGVGRPCYPRGLLGREPLPASGGLESLGCGRVSPTSACLPQPSLSVSVCLCI